jgi:hypothetical protein
LVKAATLVLEGEVRYLLPDKCPVQIITLN